MKRYKTVNEYIEASDHWREELVQLRKVLLSSKLEETVKWGMPCYTLEGKMVVGLGAFKSFVALWFFQGALLSDEKKLLINAQQGRTKAQRQWRFLSNKEINPTLIMSYVEEAIQLQVKGLEIKPVRNKPLNLPPQLEDALSKNEKAHAGFKELTKGKQREYADYVSDAKREETKTKRIEKIIPKIVEGVGLNDQYRLS